MILARTALSLASLACLWLWPVNLCGATPKLRFNARGEFKIAQFADCMWEGL